MIQQVEKYKNFVIFRSYMIALSEEPSMSSFIKNSLTAFVNVLIEAKIIRYKNNQTIEMG